MRRLGGIGRGTPVTQPSVSGGIYLDVPGGGVSGGGNPGFGGGNSVSGGRFGGNENNSGFGNGAFGDSSGGGGSFGGGQPKTCNKCGKTGHFGRDCPQGGGDGGGFGGDSAGFGGGSGGGNNFREQHISTGINFEHSFNIRVEVTGNDVERKPIQSFSCAGFNKPTPILQNAMPHILAKQDLMACAQIGSGKTGALTVQMKDEGGGGGLGGCGGLGSSAGGGGGRNCYNCGKPGHMSRECQEPRSFTGGFRGQKTCNKCGEAGHLARACPQDGGDGGGGFGEGRKCFNCGNAGHSCYNCEKPAAKCTQCGRYGHLSPYCPNSNGICLRCKGIGHLAKECPTIRNDERKCYACGKVGHISRECPEGNGDNKKCYHCGDLGHIARDCQQKVEIGRPRPVSVSVDTTSGDLGRGNGFAAAASGGGGFENAQNVFGGGRGGVGVGVGVGVSVSGDGVSGDGVSGSDEDEDEDENDFGWYAEAPEITRMSADETAALRLSLNNMTVRDVGYPKRDRVPMKPVKTFKQAFSSYSGLLEQVEKQNFTEPTPIQCQMWPIAFSGNDVIGVSQSGTGKTLGFLFPIFVHLDGQPGNRDGAGALIITPTRELAQQVHTEVEKYFYKNMKSACVYGGGGNQERDSQKQRIESGVDIIIGTPGRLKDFVDDNVVDLSTITFVVLDQADRMLKMGFEPDMRSILSNSDLPVDRQTIMTSATWSMSMQKMAESYTKDAFIIIVGNLDLSTVNLVMQQISLVSNDQEKKDMLADLLLDLKPNEKVVVFVGSRKRAQDLDEFISTFGIKSDFLHTKLDKTDRIKALRGLAKGNVPVLVSTHTMSCFVEISDITHVFNYDFPNNIEEYVHHVGRTGLAGKAGVAITLMTHDDRALSTELIKILRDSNQQVPDDLARLSERYEREREKFRFAAVDPKPYSHRRRKYRADRVARIIG